MASRSLNKVILIGNLTRDPELRYTPQGTAVCTIGLATNRSWTTDAGEKREETEFHRLVAWNKLAELCAQLLTKGRKIYVEGRLQTRSWTAQDGSQRTTTEVVIDDMILLDSKKSVGAAEAALAETPSASQTPSPAGTTQGAVLPTETALGSPTAAPKATDDTQKKRKKGKAEDGKEKEEEEEITQTQEESDEEPKEDINADDIPF